MENLVNELNDSVDLANKLADQMERQIKGIGNVIDEVINKASSQEEKNKMIMLKSMVGRVIKKAKNGEDYGEAIEMIKNQFKV